MKRLIVVALTLGLFGCGNIHRSCAQLTGSSEMCVDGILYIQFSSGATPKVDANGKPIRC